MPCNYNDYPKNWKTEIRPAILTRAFNHCEFCNIKNRIIIIRGERNGKEVYQDDGGNIYDANNSYKIGSDYLGTVGDKPFVEIVLTIMHLDHDTKNNDYSNLKAGCQRCHNRYDSEYRKANRRINRDKKQSNLF